MSSSNHGHGSDMTAAFMGLFFGAIALLCIITTIVHLTNAKYAGETPAAAAHS